MCQSHLSLRQRYRKQRCKKARVAARLQAAAAYNVQEHVVLPVGKASLGTAREVRTSKEEKRETLKYVASRTRETKSAHRFIQLLLFED